MKFLKKHIIKSTNRNRGLQDPGEYGKIVSINNHNRKPSNEGRTTSLGEVSFRETDSFNE